ncbi:MAG TPA: carboxypeptidase-like regulatory domain-containing protein [Terriglobales bacterium]
MNIRKLGYIVVALGLTLPAWSANRTATISGYVRNGGGVPQMGAAVDVLGSALQSLRVFTDDKGFFSVHGLVPGTYSVKVSAPAFLPTLREKIAAKAGANVLLNLTLSTLFDAVQFSPRRGAADDGDWNWVLRSTANRPVLRILPDGSPAMVAKAEPGPDFRGTLSFLAGSPSQGFGSVSGMSTAFRVEKSFFASDTLNVGGNVGYGPGLPNAVVRASYKHRMVNGSSPEISFTMRRLSTPDLGLRDANLQALALAMSDDINLGDIFELKFGSELQSIQFMGKVTAMRPYGSIAAHLSTDTVVEYKYSTSRPDRRAEKGFESAPADLSETDPRMSMSDYSPTIEKAHHQEVSLSHREGATSMQVAMYNDRVVNPALTGVGEFTGPEGDILPDVYSGTFTYQGRDLETRGMRLVLERKLTSDVTATMDYGFGGVLDLNSNEPLLRDARTGSIVRYRHMVAAKLSGQAPGTKTRWIASYGWTSGRALTPVDMFNASAGQADPYLDIFFRQPIPGTASLPGHMDVLVEIRNLLAQGYVPVFGQDGRTVYLVQSARAVRGGVAFSF